MVLPGTDISGVLGDDTGDSFSGDRPAMGAASVLDDPSAKRPS
mgnify:CR=1 FL=1